jgi:hypothetical protein
MSKYQVGDKVLIRANRGFGWNGAGLMDKYCNTVMTIRAVRGCNLYRMEEDKHENNGGWSWSDDDIVKKITTNKDLLKTGVFGITDGKARFVIVGDVIVYSEGGWDSVASVNDNLELKYSKIDKLFEGVKSFKWLSDALHGDLHGVTLIYDRERERDTVKDTPKDEGIKIEIGKKYKLRAYDDVTHHVEISKAVWNEIAQHPVIPCEIRTNVYCDTGYEGHWWIPKEAFECEWKEPPKYKAGDKVEVIDNTCCHGCKIGDILTILSGTNSNDKYY